MGLNKFITKKGRVLLDLTGDTVTPETLGKGVTAHDRSGEPIVGTMEGDTALPIEVATEAEMTALLETAEVGSVYKYTGTTGTYENGALYVVESAFINFTVSGKEYQAEDGMTWLEWVGSDYNTDNEWVCTSGSGRVVGTRIYNYSYITKDGTAVVGNDVIDNGYAYGTQNTGQGGGAG